MFEERFAGRVPDLRWRLVCLCLSGAFGGCEPGSSPSAFPAWGVPEALGQAGGGESEPQLRWARGLLWPPWSWDGGGCSRTLRWWPVLRPCVLSTKVPPATPASRCPPPACWSALCCFREVTRTSGLCCPLPGEWVGLSPGSGLPLTCVRPPTCSCRGHGHLRVSVSVVRPSGATSPSGGWATVLCPFPHMKVTHTVEVL